MGRSGRIRTGRSGLSGFCLEGFQIFLEGNFSISKIVIFCAFIVARATSDTYLSPQAKFFQCDDVKMSNRVEKVNQNCMFAGEFPSGPVRTGPDQENPDRTGPGRSGQAGPSIVSSTSTRVCAAAPRLDMVVAQTDSHDNDCLCAGSPRDQALPPLHHRLLQRNI